MLSRITLFKHKSIQRTSYICNHFCTVQSKSTELPIIDISTFLSSDPSNRTIQRHENIIDNLIEIGTQTGFFYLTGFNEIVSEELMASTFKELKSFFALPLDEKMKIHASNSGYLRGYLGCGDQGHYGLDDTDKRLDVNHMIDIREEHKEKDKITDMKEVFTMGTELDLNHKHFNDLLFGPNIFPHIDILPQFKNTIDKYYNSVLSLSDNLYQLFAIALNKNCNYFDDKINEGMNSMNCIHYKPLGAEERLNDLQFGIGEHTDFECFTLLAQDIHSPSGLEVLMNDGNWHRYEPISNTFVVNFADIMARFSNDMFRSTVHRAVSPKSRSRHSIAFFRHCNFDTHVNNLKEDEIAKYKPIVAGQHMLDRVERANKALF